jgi:orotate phosphoribosyltransferase-like protein
MPSSRNAIAKELHSQEPPEDKLSGWSSTGREEYRIITCSKQVGDEITNLILNSKFEISVLLGVSKSLRVDRQCGR